ncbi:hypothetical protein J1605_008257 [Eschrichtius robustus]|uniref:Uncharacterized protein n=1 Tax=Eschrichtius robustus TaxID=9764 RepID=A0AB34GWD2_ESCRO|nr:hypothetical protein J1605_008257 [Eschrichtius robustus]
MGWRYGMSRVEGVASTCIVNVLGEVVVGVTSGRAVGGTSGPRFRQLPFPGVSPQPPQLPLSVTRRPGEIRRYRDRGSVSCRGTDNEGIVTETQLRARGLRPSSSES